MLEAEGTILARCCQRSRDFSWALEVVSVARKRGQGQALLLNFQLSNW